MLHTSQIGLEILLFWLWILLKRTSGQEGFFQCGELCSRGSQQGGEILKRRSKMSGFNKGHLAVPVRLQVAEEGRVMPPFFLQRQEINNQVAKSSKRLARIQLVFEELL